MKGVKGFQKGNKVGNRFLTGNPGNSIKGWKHTPEAIEKMRQARLGTKHTKEAKQKMSAARRGEKNWNWKGGLAAGRSKIWYSEEYKQWRKSVFERDSYTCQMCNARCGNGVDVYLQADHIKPFALYPQLRFEVSNGRVLCCGCHGKVTSEQHKSGVFTNSVKTRFQVKEHINPAY